MLQSWGWVLRRREAVPQQWWRSLAKLSMSNVINPGPRLRELSFHRQRLVFFHKWFYKDRFQSVTLHFAFVHFTCGMCRLLITWAPWLLEWKTLWCCCTDELTGLASWLVTWKFWSSKSPEIRKGTKVMGLCPHFDYDFQRFAKLPRNPTIMVLKFY